MFRAFMTLVRGTANEAAEAVIDSNALTILDQQIRDSSAAIEKSRKTIALAIAQERREQDRTEQLQSEIADLETRAREALQAGREDLAGEAAETIAVLENEHEGATRAQQTFARESHRLRRALRIAESRLRELERGRRIAKTNEAALRLRDRGLPLTISQRTVISEAEDTLARLQVRQNELVDATQVLAELDPHEGAGTISEKMADAGFGPPIRSQARDVLDRLRGDLADSKHEHAEPATDPSPQT